MNLSYIINQLGEERENYFGAVSAPIVQTSNFAFPTVADYRKAMEDEKKALIYTRGNNPTVTILAKKLAALQGSEEALVFSSGMAAISAAVLSQLKGGDHVVCVENVYGWTRQLLTGTAARFGVETTFVRGIEPADFEEAIRPETRLFVLESPSSLMLECQDLEAVAAIARRHGIITILDNSYAGVLSRSPIAMGIDMVVHSASKYIGGHSDLVAGVLCSSSALIEDLFHKEFLTLGGIISPHEAWLMIRSLRTLPLRLERSGTSAARVVDYLEQHPAVSRVYYPHSPSHPQWELARKHMPEPMPMFTIALNCDQADAIEAFCNRLAYFLLAPSWGGHESLIFPTCVFNNQDVRSGMPINLIRFYIGLEEPDVLIADLEAALQEIPIQAPVEGSGTSTAD